LAGLKIKAEGATDDKTEAAAEAPEAPEASSAEAVTPAAAAAADSASTLDPPKDVAEIIAGEDVEIEDLDVGGYVAMEGPKKQEL